MQRSVHDISPTEVSEVSKLRRAGLQRLRSISATEPTVFRFTLPLNKYGNTALIQITVHPIERDNSRHPFYDVCLQYETTHPHHPIDHKLVDQVQYVYNAYIQAIRRIFDFQSFERCQELLPCDKCSDAPVPSGERSSVVPRATITDCLPTPESTSKEWQVLGMSDTRLAPLLSHARTSDVRIGVKRPGGPKGLGLAGRKAKKRKRQTVDEIIEALVATVLEGSEENSKKGFLPPRNLDELAKSIITKCQDVSSSQELDRLLLELAAEFTENKRNVEREAKVSAWFNWYFSSCLHRFRHQINTDRGDRRQDQRSCAIEVLHSIINILLFTDGINALSVITSFAVKQRVLSAAAMRDFSDRQEISMSVAKSLRGKLQAPTSFSIPNPTCCVTILLDKGKDFMKSTRDCRSLFPAYQYLDIPNLAVLRLQETVKDGKAPMGVIPFSDLQARWAAFENTTPQVRQLRQLLHLVEGFEPPSEAPLFQLQESIASLNSGNIDYALVILERLEGDSESGHMPGQPENPGKRLDLVREASSLLSSCFSRCIRDSLEPNKSADISDTSGRAEVHGVAWDPIGDWAGIGTSNFAELDGDETLAIFFDVD